eukprot:832968-Rhodomonas_salina.2
MCVPHAASARAAPALLPPLLSLAPSHLPSARRLCWGARCGVRSRSAEGRGRGAQRGGGGGRYLKTSQRAERDWFWPYASLVPAPSPRNSPETPFLPLTSPLRWGGGRGAGAAVRAGDEQGAAGAAPAGAVERDGDRAGPELLPPLRLLPRNHLPRHRAAPHPHLIAPVASSTERVGGDGE